jgi:hypothetical protein
MISRPTILNPMLYRVLRSRFGEVRVTHAGEARVAMIRADAGGEARLVVRQHGESYAVCCCFCGDRRFRLSINHMYGQRDPGSGRLLTNLAYCHANNCMVSYDNRVELAGILSADKMSDLARVLPGKFVADEERCVALPCPRTRLDRLPAQHHARAYLAGRGFDPDRLGRAYRLCYCDGGDDPLARHRVIIPVYQDGLLKGWQSLRVLRPVSRPDTSPTYLTARGLRVSRLLYNLDHARHHETGVLVAEPAHVWAFGRMALAPLGPSVSDHQYRRLVGVFRKRTVVVLMSEAALEWDPVSDLILELQYAMPRRVAVVPLPRTLATGSTRRAALRAYVTAQAKVQGVKISYAKQT